MTPLPGVIRSIKKGFNLVSKHAYLLVIPLVIDLFLLFGPKLRINEALQPMINAAFSQMGSGLTRTGAAQLDVLSVPDGAECRPRSQRYGQNHREARRLRRDQRPRGYKCYYRNRHSLCRQYSHGGDHRSGKQ